MIRLSLVVLLGSLAGLATAFAQTTLAPEAGSNNPAGEPVAVPSVSTPRAEAVPCDKPEGNSPRKEEPREPAFNALEEFLKPTFKIRGLIETEAVMATQSDQSRDTIGELQNGYGFRRARLGAQGNFGDSTRWISEIELAGGRVQLMDVFVGVTAFPWVREVRIGHFREPFSLEGNTGVPVVTFLERSPLNELDPARNWGVAGFWWPDSERGTFVMGIFRNGTGNDGQSLGNEDTWSYTARVTGLPVYQPDGPTFNLVHLGGAISYRNPSNGVVSFNPGTPPSLLAIVDNPDTPFLPAVNIAANSQQLYNLQVAQVAGPFSLQGEWLATAVQQTAAGFVFLHGFYVQSSYFLTGEHRGYDQTRGAFGRVKVLRPMIRTQDIPGGGCGAVELAVRYSFFDYNSPSLPLGMNGLPPQALLHQFELGVNWYLNDQTRFMFNYTLPIVKTLGRDAITAHVFGVRAALYW